MSTVKISELASISELNSNTSNTIFVTVDLPSGLTGKITGTILGRGLYAYNPLYVGITRDAYPNTMGQFTGSSNTYVQVNLENTNEYGTSDYVVTANTYGTDTQNYIDLGYTNSLYDPYNPYNSLGTAIEPLSGYLYVQGNTSGGISGNLVVGTTMTGTETRFISGGINSENIIFKVDSNGIHVTQNSHITFGDNTTQNTAAASNAYSIMTFNIANTANVYAHAANTWLKANDALTLTLSKAYTDNANSFIQSHYVANTSAIDLPGNLRANGDFVAGNSTSTNTLTVNQSASILGNTSLSGILSVKNSQMSPNEALININASDNFGYVTPSNSYYMMHITGKSNNSTRIVFDSFGQNTYPLLAGRSGRGSSLTPSATSNNDVLLRIVGNGYTGTQFPASSPSKIDFVASENFSDSNRGTRIEFWNTKVGSNTLYKIASFNSEIATFSGYVEPQRGFIYTPKVYIGAQTSITLDFTVDSMLRGTFTTGGITVVPSNFVPGKVVELWLTNVAGNGQTINHGCSANNSTIGATSFTIPASSSAYLRYFSIDGDAANTFVSISKP